MKELEETVAELAEQKTLLSPDVADRVAEKKTENIPEADDAVVLTEDHFADTHVNVEAESVQRNKTSMTVETDLELRQEEKGVDDFVQYFNDRFERMSNLLMQRREMQQATSIANIQGAEQGRDVTFIGMVDEKRNVKNGRAILHMSDRTGQVKVLTSEETNHILLEDDVIGIQGSVGDGIIYADEIVYPDVPIREEPTTTEEEVYAAFISDPHFGSKDTLYNKLDALADWLAHDKQAEKVHYLVIAGDIVEGVGIYANQRNDLTQEDIYKQYARFEEFVQKLPPDLAVVVAPGNHDIVRLAEPQPQLPKAAVPNIHDLSNIYFPPNPASVMLHNHTGNGIRTLVYHGYSFDGHVDQLPHLRKTAYRRPEQTMIDWMKRRHLAPRYQSTLLSPTTKDHLLIENVPDIFVFGHIHSFALTTYKHTNLICAGTFQKQTDFQKRMGHVPNPGKAALVNLKTRACGWKVF